jgi:hypothetical protein
LKCNQNSMSTCFAKLQHGFSVAALDLTAPLEC